MDTSLIHRHGPNLWFYGNSDDCLPLEDFVRMEQAHAWAEGWAIGFSYTPDSANPYED